ncbi:merozoite surface protein CMZ-8-like [Bicyclus anynana]|uniref:Merozoite surface protein CMZ-8-like n=1 Tax=Bicyclus anynana TaxID=110368 RepID=A0A6J1P5M9_BICAN|nr:merozoite surface protein CMZ-8-like [Bicyclus anynana]
MDNIKMSSMNNKLPPGADPCNPLYWYPRAIPDFCEFDSTITPPSSEEPPADLPQSPPVLIPMPPPPLPILPPPLPILPPPYPMLPPPIPILPMPNSPLNGPPPPIPLFPAHPSSSISVLSNPYSYSHLNPVSSQDSISYYPSYLRPSTGFVPGIHGLVTKDGGINIMPFSDVYADMLQKHKNKMVRRKLQKILDKYEYNPYSYKTLQKYERYFTDDK